MKRRSMVITMLSAGVLAAVMSWAHSPLIGQWPFDEVSAVTQNALGGNDAEIIGASLVEEAELGKVLHLTAPAYVDMPVRVFSRLDDEVTIAFRAKPVGTKTRGRFFQGASGAESGISAFYEHGLIIWEVSENRVQQKLDPASIAEKWSHFAFVKQTSGGLMRIYLDGELIAQSLNQTDRIPGAALTHFFVGARADDEKDNEHDGFEGLISDFRIYKTALNASQVRCLAISGEIPEASPGGVANDIFNIGMQKQLFVDDYMISRMENIRRELGRVKKENDGKPVVMADKRWEHWNRLGFYFTAAYDEYAGNFKLWYLAQHEGWRDMDGRTADNTSIGYAESADGLAWRKPLKGVAYSEIDEKAPDIPSNIVLVGAHGFGCLIDPIVPWGHPEKYKAAFDSEFDMRPDGGNYTRTCLAYSADGIRWTLYNNGKHVTGRAADTQNQIVWDYIGGRYMLICREDLAGDVEKGENRGTRIMVHDRGNNIRDYPADWRTLKIIGFDREGPDELYRRQIHAMTVWPYENIYLGFLSALEFYNDDGEDEDQGDLDTRHEKNIVNFYIATSRDAIDWDMEWAYLSRPLIPRGPPGSFDKDGVHVPNLVTHQDRHWIYYNSLSERFGHNDPKAPMTISLATLRLDGFVCLEAQDQWGTVLTKPFHLEGNGLLINVDANSGQARVEILDEAGEPFPGFSASEAETYQAVDALRLMPKWNHHQDLASLKGQTIRLKFHLYNAKLYSFAITP